MMTNKELQRLGRYGLKLLLQHNKSLLQPFLEEKKKWKNDFLFKKYKKGDWKAFHRISKEIEEIEKILPSMKYEKGEKSIQFNHIPRTRVHQFFTPFISISQVTDEMLQKEDDWVNDNLEYFLNK